MYGYAKTSSQELRNANTDNKYARKMNMLDEAEDNHWRSGEKSTWVTSGECVIV